MDNIRRDLSRKNYLDIKTRFAQRVSSIKVRLNIYEY